MLFRRRDEVWSGKTSTTLAGLRVRLTFYSYGGFDRNNGFRVFCSLWKRLDGSEIWSRHDEWNVFFAGGCHLFQNLQAFGGKLQ